ncbi:hypothetical protein [Streptomyces sp. HNM0574]|uniref:hypothetical protein n=1 Tax=Streptomyces sp. HNM0574 TaxID=2714954 RepID=UPI00146AE6DB|nr:hypothetical protein [Streptomyces sp. HNM0574]NLU67774.1 hypothetical protein [Streptomyces sp. HNM0574]
MHHAADATRAAPHRRGRALALAAATAVLLGLSGGGGMTASHAAPAGQAQRTADRLLSCEARTPAGRPLTFRPALTQSPRTVRVRGTLRLSACTASGKAARALRTGVLRADVPARAGCTSVRPGKGRATVTWYDKRGHRAGTSRISTTPRTLKGFSPGDTLLGGKVTAGPLTGARVGGSTTPTSDVTRCAVSGLRSLSGAGKIVFTR